MTVTQLVWTILKILIMVMFVLNLAAILTWADRRQSSMIQDRIGPNRAVIRVFGKEFRLAGLLHPAADGLKFFTKEDSCRRRRTSSSSLWRPSWRWAWCSRSSLGVGILYVFAMSGQGIIAAAIAGWSSDNKFSLMGALRAASQMVSYEVTLARRLASVTFSVSVLTTIGLSGSDADGRPASTEPNACFDRRGCLSGFTAAIP